MIKNPPTPRVFAGRRPLALWCAVALACCVTAARATVIINDTWIDGNRNDPARPVYSENGTDADADGNLESAWFNTDNSATSMVIVPGVGANQILRTTNGSSSSSWTTYFTPSNSTPLTLTSVGDSIKVTWVFTPTGVGVANTSQNLRVAVVDTPDANRIGTNGSPGTAAYLGYAMFMNMGTPTLGGAAFQLKERTSPGTPASFLSTSGDWTTVASGGPTSGEGYLDGSNYTFVIQFTLQSGGALQIISTMTGANIGGVGQLSVTNVDATPNSLTFDTFGIRPSSAAGTAVQFDTSLFKVERFTGGCVPTLFNVTGTTNICPGNTAPVGLSGSEVNVAYQLRLAGSPVGAPVAGTGSPLSFGLQGAGTYTVNASNTTITCEGLMNGSAVIAEYASPVVTTNPAPVDATNVVGGTRSFSVTATGSSLAYQWRKDGINLVNGGNISGATSATLILSALTTNSAGAYDVVVSNTICGTTATSLSANLTILTAAGDLFRSVTSGDWSDVNVWEQSTNQGGSYFTPAIDIPSNLSSNVLVQAGHTVTLTSDQTVRKAVIQAGATLEFQTGGLTINDGASAVDVDVLGTIQMNAGGGALNVGSAVLRFGNGGVFNWNRTTAPAVPTATWQDGSTCRISATASSTATATGLSGQSFYDLVYDTSPNGQSARCRLDIQGTNTTVRRDFSITIPDTASASVTINNSTGGILTVGRDVTFTTGASDTSTKVLLNNAAGNSYTLKVGRNFTVTGNIDGFGSSSTVIEFTGAGTHTLSLPVQPNLITSSSMNWLVDSGATVQLGSQIDGFSSFTNNGTLNFGVNQIIRGTTLAFNAGGVVNAHGTNYIATNVNTLVAGGTINLGTLPALALGDTFQFINAATYTGTFGTLLPATPDVTHVWDVSQLNTAATLTVANPGVGPATNPTNIVSSFSGGNLTLSWPTDHIGWTLQTQTNSRSVGLTPATNTWFNVSGSTTTNSVVFPVSQATPTVFFRLKL